jgi:hypothetical protein
MRLKRAGSFAWDSFESRLDGRSDIRLGMGIDVELYVGATE